jgi:hypothetical protein
VKGECERLVVGPHGEISALQLVAEMANGGGDGVELSVKSTVLLEGCIQLLREEA